MKTFAGTLASTLLLIAKGSAVLPSLIFPTLFHTCTPRLSWTGSHPSVRRTSASADENAGGRPRPTDSAGAPFRPGIQRDILIMAAIGVVRIASMSGMAARGLAISRAQDRPIGYFGPRRRLTIDGIAIKPSAP